MQVEPKQNQLPPQKCNRGADPFTRPDFELHILADLSVLKAQMKDLVGNGQPGRLTRIESRISDHERAVQRLKGAAATLGAALTFAHLAIDFLFHH